MNQPGKCPRCGAALPAGALQGLCPACLLRQGAAADTATQPEAPSGETPSLEEVARLFPQFEVLELLGRGGMGSVYKARQPALDRFVALKVLPRQSGTEAAFAERFHREARALARLSHPNIVAVHDFGQTADVPWLLMEYVDGANLRQLQRSRRLAPREALQLVPQICDALQYAHDEGIVHRDIKPENVLVDRRGRVKIADFGLARILGAEVDDLRLTGEGQVMGTPHYMAPEQVEHPLEVDHRADIYALGVVFYELLTGELPLGKFPPPSRRVQVDLRLDEVVLRTLEKEPARRYQQAAEVKTDLETISDSPRERRAGSASGAPVTDRETDPGLNPSAALRWRELEPRRKALLWYGLMVSALGIPAGWLLDLPWVSGLALVGLLIVPHKLGWWHRWQARGPGRFAALSSWFSPGVERAGGEVAGAGSRSGPRRAIPPSLWPALLTLGVAAVVQAAKGLDGLPSGLGDLLLLTGLVLRWRVAWVATLFFAAFGVFWALVVAGSGLALGVLGVNGVVAASVWLGAPWFFRGPPDSLSRQRSEALLGLFFLLVPGGFLAALTGDVFGFDIDAQFYAALFGLPAATGLAGLLVWSASRPGAADSRQGMEPGRWSWRAIAAAIVLGLNLPLFGTALLIVREIAGDPDWNPAPTEAAVTFAVIGASLVLTVASVTLGLQAQRNGASGARGRRGRRLAWACVWLWPALLVAAFSVRTERVDPSSAARHEERLMTQRVLEQAITVRAAVLGVRLDGVEVRLFPPPARALCRAESGPRAAAMGEEASRFCARLTPGESGRWQVRGEAELEGLRFWVAADPADRAARSRAPTGGFTPTLTAVLSVAQPGSLHDAFLDLETGRVLSAPETLTATLRAAGGLPTPGGWQIQSGPLLDWMRDQGVDLVLRPGRAGLTLLDGTGVPVGNGRGDPVAFDAPEAGSVAAFSSNVVEILRIHRERRPDEPVCFWLEPRDEQQTWLFRNREGRAGVIELTATADNGREAWLRWKLLRDAPAERRTPEAPEEP